MCDRDIQELPPLAAPRWRLLPSLANPGKPAMGLHVEGRKAGTHHTDKTVERKGGTGKEKLIACENSPDT